MGYVSTIDIFVTSLNINFLFHPPTDFKKQPVPYYKGTPVFPMDEFLENFHTASELPENRNKIFGNWLKTIPKKDPFVSFSC